MLFNSFEFIFFFLPLVLLVFFVLGTFSRPVAATAWLVCASLFFYGWWNPAYLGLILGSIVFNFVVGDFLSRYPRRELLVFGVVVNLGLLGYFKYFNFFVANLNDVTEDNFACQGKPCCPEIFISPLNESARGLC